MLYNLYRNVTCLSVGSVYVALFPMDVEKKNKKMEFEKYSFKYM